MLRLVLALGMAIAFPLAAVAQDASGSVDVVVVGGPVDHRTVAFVIDAITGTDADLVILQLNVGAVLDASIADLIALVLDPPVPVVAWIGPEPATVQGAAVRLFSVAAIRGAAPGVTIGRASPPLAGGAPASDGPSLPAGAIDDLIVVTEPDGVLVDVVAPSIGQFVVGLHGRSVTVGGAVVTLDTAHTEVIDGVDRVSPSVPVRFVSEGLIDRVLHTTLRPEAAFFFLLAGLTLAVFEFYAAGPGLAAAVGAGCLLLAGYGLAVMPTWWPAPLAAVLGVALYVSDFQHNDLRWRSLLGTGLLLFAGLRLVDGSPHLVPVWWTVVLIVMGTALFFSSALTTVARARFSTATIGRSHLIGRQGVAVVAVQPDGEVEVDGVRWQARSTRRSGIAAGDAVVVSRIDGIVLEVDPPPEPMG